MPGLVTSMEVVPPMRTENSGIYVSRMALILVRRSEAEEVAQFADSVSFVDAGFSHVNGGGAAHAHGELRDIRVEDGFDLGAQIGSRGGGAVCGFRKLCRCRV